MTARLPLILLAALAFSGCTTIALEPLPDGMTDQPPADWTERSRNLGRFDHWHLSGKLAVKQPSDRDRKSTRLNSSHVRISYAVFCLKKKKKKRETNITQ